MVSLGPFCSEGITFLKGIDSRMTMATGDTCETAHLFQKLSYSAIF